MSAPAQIPAGWSELELRGLILDPTTEAPVVVLRQSGGTLLLPIWIGPFEANAIALAVEEVEVPRPLTHDLLRAVIGGLGATVQRVEIHDLRGGTFYARLVLDRNGTVTEVDARPSDAVALALRTRSPIWAAATVLQAALNSSRAMEETDEERIREWLERAGPEELGKYSM
jgi:bifunctional DNase/RNase